MLAKTCQHCASKSSVPTALPLVSVASWPAMNRNSDALTRVIWEYWPSGLPSVSGFRILMSGMTQRRRTWLPFAIGRTEDVRFGGQHHLIERLGEHRRGEKGDRAQRVGADIGEVMAHVRRYRKHAAGTNDVLAVVHAQFAGAGDDVLGLFGRVSVPAE